MIKNGSTKDFQRKKRSEITLLCEEASRQPGLPAWPLVCSTAPGQASGRALGPILDQGHVQKAIKALTKKWSPPPTKNGTVLAPFLVEIFFHFWFQARVIFGPDLGQLFGPGPVPILAAWACDCRSAMVVIT